MAVVTTSSTTPQAFFPGRPRRCLGDTPGLASQTIDSVRDAWDERRPWGLVAEYDDGPGHPFVFGAAAFDALRALHGDKAVWKLLDRHAHEVAEVPIPGPVPIDVDTWADYEALIA